MTTAMAGASPRQTATFNLNGKMGNGIPVFQPLIELIFH